MPGIDSEQQLIVNQIMWAILNSALRKERVLYYSFVYKKELHRMAEEIRPVALKQLFVRVRKQQKRLQAIIDENSPLSDTVARRRSEKTKRLLPADILQKNVVDLHEKIMAETSILLGEANNVVAIVKLDKQTARVQTQLVRLHTLIDQSNPNRQPAARGTRRTASKPPTGDASVMMADLHKKVIDQTLTLHAVAKDLLVSVQERLAEAKASRQRFQSKVLKINRITGQCFGQLEKQVRECWALFAEMGDSGSREWIAGRRAAMRRIQAALADRLRMGARTRTEVGREPGGGEGGDIAVSFAAAFKGL
jgi:hypothetical protein